jgi:hypothetical protein
MELVELSDLIGAINGYIEKRFNLNVSDLFVMSIATKRAFEDGTRTSRE